MFTLDYIQNNKREEYGNVGDMISTPTPRSVAGPAHRTRSNSQSSSMSEARARPPHTEGHIKWLTTM